jgi:hypothetical protein
MRGLSYPPVLESEVLVLFGMLIPYLDDEFIIKEFNTSPGFPDCYALKNNVEVGIEFEVNSNHFYEHGHDRDANVDKCDLIVCWKNTINLSYITVNDRLGRRHQIEILELERVIKEKSLYEQLFPIKKPKPPAEWDEEKFLLEVRKRVTDEKVFSWIRELIETCKQFDEFVIVYGKGARHATLGLHVKKWRSQRIGVPTPIQFLDNGNIIFDCKNLSKIPEIEKELRSRINQIRTKKWSRWCTIPIKDEEAFATIRETIKWLSDAIREASDKGAR